MGTRLVANDYILAHALVMLKDIYKSKKMSHNTPFIYSHMPLLTHLY